MSNRPRKCLMVKTKDNRSFFTHERYYPQLTEFSKTFGAEISVVKVKDGEVLDLIQLAPAICNSDYNPRPDIEIIETKIPARKRCRSKLLKNSQKIRDYIESQFRNGATVSLQALMNRYKRLRITSACLCHHVKVVREQLEKDGMTIIKVGGGKYQMIAQ